MTQLRWSNGRQAWVFEADLSSEESFRSAALDVLIEAGLNSRRRIHDGATHRNYYWYEPLHLDMTHEGWDNGYVTVLWVPHMRIWADVPSWIQQSPYDTADWYQKVLKMDKHLRNLMALCSRVVSIVADQYRRPSEW